MDPKLRSLVQDVSRSFSLTLLGLPNPQRDSIALTYLLARYADTLADAGRWPTFERQKWLEAWETAILAGKAEWKFNANVGSFNENEAKLLLEGGEILRLFHALQPYDHEAGVEVLKTLIHAMKWDLKTFSETTAENPTAGVKDLAMFDWYCQMIAGCVGAYWVKIFQLPENLEALATAYGRGLQRINILRDVPEDWNRGRIYLPRASLEKLGFIFTKPLWRQPVWKSFCETYLQETSGLLQYGANFCDALPYRQIRLRFASIMPLQIGLATVAKLKTAVEWEPPVKISRPDVRFLAISSLGKLMMGIKESR